MNCNPGSELIMLVTLYQQCLNPKLMCEHDQSYLCSDISESSTERRGRKLFRQLIEIYYSNGGRLRREHRFFSVNGFLKMINRSSVECRSRDRMREPRSTETCAALINRYSRLNEYQKSVFYIFMSTLYQQRIIDIPGPNGKAFL